jgi:hypothetical protein
LENSADHGKTRLIGLLAFTSTTAALLRFFGGLAGVIALFWLIRLLFDRLDSKR